MSGDDIRAALQAGEHAADIARRNEFRDRIRAYWDGTATPAIRDYLRAFDAFGVDRLERNRVKPEGMTAREHHAPHVHAQTVKRRELHAGESRWLGGIRDVEELHAVSAAKRRIAWLWDAFGSRMMPGGHGEQVAAHIETIAFAIERHGVDLHGLPRIARVDDHDRFLGPRARIEPVLVKHQRLHLADADRREMFWLRWM